MRLAQYSPRDTSRGIIEAEAYQIFNRKFWCAIELSLLRKLRKILKVRSGLSGGASAHTERTGVRRGPWHVAAGGPTWRRLYFFISSPRDDFGVRVRSPGSRGSARARTASGNGVALSREAYRCRERC